MLLRTETNDQWWTSERMGAQHGYVHVSGIALKSPAAVAYVNRGVWLADCVFGCGAARAVSPTLTGYWCAGCGNVQVGGQEVPMQWPDNLDAIEAVLVLRPSEDNRNWSPTMTVPGRNRKGEDVVMDLAVENLERGLPVPSDLQGAVNTAVEADWTTRGLALEMQGWQDASVKVRRNPLQGPKGDKGDPGPKGDKGDPGGATPGPIRVGTVEGLN